MPYETHAHEDLFLENLGTIKAVIEELTDGRGYGSFTLERTHHSIADKNTFGRGQLKVVYTTCIFRYK